jgi:DNA-binding beta-propeller fold protein YncE
MANLTMGPTASVAYVAKDGSMNGVLVPNLATAPAVVVGTGLGAYAIATTSAGTQIYSLTANAATQVLTDTSGMGLGIAAQATIVYYTLAGGRVWSFDALNPSPKPARFSMSASAPMGPIIADDQAVFWPVDGSPTQMLRAGFGGPSSQAAPITMPLPAPVYALATDATNVYWTDTSGGVYFVDKLGTQSVTTLHAPDPTNPMGAYGIAVAPDGSVYFAYGSQVFRTLLFALQTTPLPGTYMNPHGIAVDGTYVYVADHGSGTSNGAIWKVAHP